MIGAYLRKFALILISLIVACVVSWIIFDPDKKPADMKPADMKLEEPKDGMVYVWSLPDRGHQSLLILNVIDGTAIDAAYLVPVRIKLRGLTTPALTDKGGKEAYDALDKLIGGQLRTAQLLGAGPEGIFADFWIPSDKEGGKGQWLSDILIKQGVAKRKQ